MPLVFVHGVNVREEPSSSEEVAARNAYFKEFLLEGIVADPQKVQIFNPYWGQYGVKFAWKQASLPTKDIEELGPEDDLTILLLNQIVSTEVNNSNAFLIEMAKQQTLEDVVDLLWAVGAEGASEQQGIELARLALRAVNYAHHNPHPTWLDSVDNDEAFLDTFEEVVNKWHISGQSTNQSIDEQWETLGTIKGWGLVEEGLERVKKVLQKSVRKVALQTGVSVAKSRITSSVVGSIRPFLHKNITRFIGDVFVYLNERGTAANPGSIVQEIINHLEQAQRAISSEDNKLIVVAHSMGGNIMYDILTYFKPELEVDFFITVGSQVALFEEMKCFQASNKAVPVDPKVDRVQKPENIKHWINVLDYNDVLGFSMKDVFENVEDYRYSTKDGVISHITYFLMPTFYQRLKQRIQELGE